jgi:hypothetical protein
MKRDQVLVQRDHDIGPDMRCRDEDMIRATVAFTTLANEEKSLELLLRYETTYTRMYDRAQKALLRLRNENLRNDPNTDPPEPKRPRQSLLRHQTTLSLPRPRNRLPWFHALATRES